MAWLTRHHLTRAEEHRVVAAIRAAERGHRGEIRVHVEARYPGEGPVARAAELFEELCMADTAEGTGVLLYVATLDRKAAVWAGPGLYERAREPGFWREVVAEVAQGFARGDRAGGLERALAKLGALLREVAPGEDVRGNELPDTVSQS